MKHIILAALLFFIINSTLSAQEWLTDITIAKEQAIQENKPIILVFQGSDWCAPCMKLDREIWSTDVFKNYSKEHYVLLQADFPRRKQNKLSQAQEEANNKLAEIYNKKGIFPFVVVLDSSGKILGETGYKKLSPEKYIESLNSFIH